MVLILNSELNVTKRIVWDTLITTPITVLVNDSFVS